MSQNNTTSQADLIDIAYELEGMADYMDYQDIPEDIRRLAYLRHQAHTRRLNDVEEVNSILNRLGINKNINDVDEVHEYVNAFLHFVENAWHVGGLASDGIKAMNSNF